MTRAQTWLGLAALVFGVALVAPGDARASQLITFDDLPDPGNHLGFIPNGYDGLNFYWNGLYYLNAANYALNPSGYQNSAASGTNVASDTHGFPASFGSDDRRYFTLESVYLTAAWNDGLNIRINGYKNSTLLYTQNVVVGTDHPTEVNLDFANIDAVEFYPSGGTSHGYPDEPNYGYASEGWFFAVDSLMVSNMSPPPLPEPSSLISAALAVAVGLGFAARRLRAG